MSAGTQLSKEFFELLKAIGESKSKQEEDRIIQREVQALKKKLESPGPKKGAASPYGGPPGAPAVNKALSSRKKAKEFLVRLLYVEMLGHDGSFGYIKAVELAASSSIMHKRTGYLVCSSCLSPEHEFRFMLVNQMQRDLKSTHVLEACAALLAVTRIITEDMVPAVSPDVAALLGHASETVRKKAIIALHRCHQIAPEMVTRTELVEHLRRVLCDRDPAVMGSSLNVIEALANADPVPFKDLVPSLISILKQICEHRLPTDFDYHRVPAPWMQMKIVRILAVLGKNDANASNGMYEVLGDCMRKSDAGINAGYAVTYECVRTITAIYPNPTLLDAAAEAISRFISSRSHNLKYLGVTGLAAIVEKQPQYAAAHQLAVIECLEDRDETLQRKTLDLLYRMTNPVNVEFITEKLLHFLRGTTDPYLKKDLTLRVCNVAERYAPDNAWYIRTITELFQISGDMVKPDVAHNLMSLIAEGTGEGEEDDEADIELRRNAVEIYASLLDRPPAKSPRILLETMAWTLGEYGYLSKNHSLDSILTKLCKLARTGRGGNLPPSTRKFLLSAIMKLVAQAGTCPPHAAAVIDEYTRSRDADLQQRCLEFQSMLTSAAHVLGEVLPVDASCEDIDVDPDLSFLDGYVKEAIANGAREYSKPEDDDDDDDYVSSSGSRKKKTSAFKMTPYEKPQAPGAGAFGGMQGMGSGAPVGGSGVTPPPGGGFGTAGVADPYATTSGAAASSAATGGIDPSTGEPALVLRNVANVWGKGGVAAPAPAPTPAYGGVGGSFASSASAAAAPSPWAQPEAPAGPKELTEKERMAAALFGGIVPGAAGAASQAAAPAPAPATAAPAAAPPAPAPAPPLAPAPAPEIDLLDMSDFGDSAPAPAPAVSGAQDVHGGTDILSPTPLGETPPAAEPAVPEPAPTPAPEADPFAAEGLLSAASDAPLPTFESASSTIFEYNTQKMAPLPITTAQFGSQWGSCPATSPASQTGTKVATLAQFMDLCKAAGAHNVESIAATNEGICAGMVGGSIVALIHGKVTPLGGGKATVDFTVKSTDGTMGGCLAMFLQNMMR